MQQIKKYLGQCLLAAMVATCSNYAYAEEITAIDFDGNPLGQVISTGMVINGDGANIGYMTADSFIVDDNEKIIGGVVPQGVAMGFDNRLLGKIHSDGIVRNFSGNPLGKALPNGLIINQNADILGTILYPGLVYAADGATIGRMTGAGTYTNLEGLEIGFISANGYAYRKSGDTYVLDGRLMSAKMVVSLTGRFMGSIAASGRVVDFEGKEIGNIHANGYVYNADGQIIGGVVTTQYAFDLSGKYVGIVSYNGTVARGEQIVGYYRPDGTIVDEKDNVVGYAVPVTATASDNNGRYLGRLLPGGNIVHGTQVVGFLGARGYVYDKDGKQIGELTATGPIFDVLAQLKGLAMPNGTVTALGGNTIGNMRGKYAFDTNGTMIGASVKNMLAIDYLNHALGSSAFNATIKNGAETQKISPFGYLLGADNKVVGHSMDIGAIYTLEGLLYSYITPNATLYRQATDAILTESGVLLSAGGYVGDTESLLYARGFSGQTLGNFTQTNILVNKDGKIAYKIMPGDYVVAADNAVGQNMLPIVGFAGNKRVALSIGGDLIGYTAADGSVKDLRGGTLGKVTYRDYVIDNNNVVAGQLMPFATVYNDKCQPLGAVNGRGDIINNRDVLIGRLLPNGQAISDSGSYVGYATFATGLVDFDGRYAGTVNAGQGVDFAGKVLGCVNAHGYVVDGDKKVRYGVVTPNPVMDFENNIIAQVVANGLAVDSDNQTIGYMQPTGNVVSRAKKVLGHVMKYAVAFDNNNNFMGLVDRLGQVLNAEGEIIGNVNFDGSVTHQSEAVGYALYDFYVYDDTGATYGYLTKDGTVLSMVGSRLGKLDRGFVLDRTRHVVARGRRDYIVRNSENEAIGELHMNGTVTDENGVNVGYLADSGAVLNDAGQEIARATPFQYYVAAPEPTEKEKSAAEWADSGRVKPTAEAKVAGSSSASEEKIRKQALGNRIVGIAISPDGDIIGNIYDDDSVKNNEGTQVGFVTKDGMVLDMNYNVIGSKEINRAAANNMFVPADAFGSGNPYGIGSQPSNLGPGGGYGQGERYDPVREAALAQLQGMRRSGMAMGHVSNTYSPSSFTGYEEDGWPGTGKNISSWRVDMSQMILEDKPIPAVLARSVYASDGFGDNIPVTAIVERNVYAEEGRNIIIPAGSRVIGKVEGGSTGGNSGGAVKIGISWHRLIRPDGSQFVLNQAQTADAQGRAGAIGYLDEQLLKRYAMPLMTTALESSLAYVMASGSGSSTSSNGNSTEDARSQAAEDARTNFIDQMNSIFEDIMERKANIRSVTYVPAGTRIIIFANEDLWLNDAKRAKEAEAVRQKVGDKPVPLAADSGSVGTSVQYEGNYQENVRPVSGGGAPRSAPLTSSSVNNQRAQPVPQVPPSTTQQKRPENDDEIQLL